MNDMGFDRIINLLKEISFFEDFDEKELDLFSRQLSLRSFPKDAVLFREWEVGDYLFFIVEGSVEVRLDSTRAECVVAKFGYGHCVGEMALVDDYPRSASVHVTEPSELLILTKKKLESIIKENPAIGVKIYKGLARNLSIRLRGITGRFADLA